MDKIELDAILSRIGTLKIYAKKQMIYHQMEEPSGFYFIRNGKVRNYIVTEDGKEKTCTISIDGEFFGLAFFFDDGLNDTSAHAMEKSEIYIIDNDGMEHLYRNEHNVIVLILKSMAQKMRFLSFQMTCLAFLSADQKIAQMLVHLAERFYKSDSSQIALNCTHEDIALLSSTSRTTVTQVLNDLERRQLVSKGYRSIIIHDLETIKKNISE